MLALELVLQVMNYMGNLTLGQCVVLAQVNHNFRTVFLSDQAWAKFNVERVQDGDAFYQYGGYELPGAAAHFFNYLTSSPIPIGRWFFDAKRSSDGPTLTDRVKPEDRYTQIHALKLFDVNKASDTDFREAFVEVMPLIALDVWQLWATHLRRPMYEPLEEWFGESLPDKKRPRHLPGLALNYLFGRKGRRLPFDEMLQDEEFVLEALDAFFAFEFRRHYDELEDDLAKFVEYQWHHKGIVMKVVSVCASEALRGDRQFILEAIQSGCSLRVVSERLKTDYEVVLQAVQTDVYNLRWASPRFRGDRKIVIAAVQQDGWTLFYAAEALRDDPSVVAEAVKSDGDALKYASKELRNERQIVLLAVAKSGYALQYASETLRADSTIVSAAVKQDPDAIKYASAALRGDWL